MVWQTTSEDQPSSEQEEGWFVLNVWNKSSGGQFITVKERNDISR